MQSASGISCRTDKPVLVTYASGTGSTVGVAEAIGEMLTECGLSVQVRPMQAVKEVALYGAVVAGSAIRGRRWLPEAMQFVQNHSTELSRKPFAAFLVCMTLAMPRGDQYRKEVATWLQPVRRLVSPVSEGLFAGMLDIGKVPARSDRIKFRLAAGLGFWKEGDHRDWNAIRTWAADLAPRLVTAHAV